MKLVNIILFLLVYGICAYITRYVLATILLIMHMRTLETEGQEIDPRALLWAILDHYNVSINLYCLLWPLVWVWLLISGKISFVWITFVALLKRGF